MSEAERRRIIMKVRSELAKSMLDLRQLKDVSTISGWKQAAVVIIELGEIRARLEKMDV